MNQKTKIENIKNGNTTLGIELGSTRIKAMLIAADHTPIASGSYQWENQFSEGNWTYSLEEAWRGIQESYRLLAQEVQQSYNLLLQKIGAIGISAMMHGYLVFDQSNQLLTPFRTWRNTTTSPASNFLTTHFNFKIPQRWSIAHLYQAILNQEAHTPQIYFLTTLAGYIHWQLTGEKVIGIGDASGMFPIDSHAKDYNQNMLQAFNQLPNVKKQPWQIEQILPKVLIAGQNAGHLTQQGAKKLDPTHRLQPGIAFCPPEGDAGTGMTATNCVSELTCNVSAGTSVFAMIVLQNQLSQVIPEIDLVTTPDGAPVAMVHSNNCTSDLNEWVGLFQEFAQKIGAQMDQNTIYQILYTQALSAQKDSAGLLAYNYISGEHITKVHQGIPIFLRLPNSEFTLANFMQTHLYSALGAFKIGLEILLTQEKLKIEKVIGQGGLFKTKNVGQQIMATVFNAPVTLMDTAGEGGAWGIALLASFLLNKTPNQTLQTYLTTNVFADIPSHTITPQPEDLLGFDQFMQRYKKGLIIEHTAENTFTEQQ